jgi:BirA family biotin operon repressor/biotin-[acetyl-CoA-carboxylase] ligase
VWYRLIDHGTVASTSDEAFAALAAGTARHGDAHLAREQTAGRGRLGRGWLSARDQGLYLSLVLAPDPPAPRPTALTMAVALGVRDGLAALGARGLAIKWPNDLTVAGAKLAGILVESRGLDPARPRYVVGLGVNVRQREFPAELLAERAVTSLALLGVDTSPRAVAEAVLEALPARLAAPGAELAPDFLAATGLAGARVRARSAREEWTGRLLALDPERGLALEPDAGGAVTLPLEHVAALERLER